MVEHNGLLEPMPATPGFVRSLYQGGRVPHSLLDIGVDDKKCSNDGNSPSTSKFGSRSQRAGLLRKLGLIFIEETSMGERKLFDLVDFILKDLRCRGIMEHLLRFDKSTVALTGDHLQLLLVVLSLQRVEEEDVNGLYVNLYQINELPRASKI